MSNVSPIGAICFPHLFVAKPPSENADPRFSMLVLFDKDAQNSAEYAAMREAVTKAATNKWGADAAAMFISGALRSPFRNAAEKAKYYGFDEGKVYVSPWTKIKPGVINGRLEDVNPADVYPGMLGRFTYSCFAYDRNGNKGVAFGLDNVQITDMTTPRMDGRGEAKNEFDAMDMPVRDMPASNGADAGADDFPF